MGEIMKQLNNLTKVINLQKNKTFSGIHNDIPLYYLLARECETILECGVDHGISTRVFIWGLEDNGSENKRLDSIDINQTKFNPNCPFWKFYHMDCLKFKIKEEYDMILLDTSHTYEQTISELKKFDKYAKKYLLIHDYSNMYPDDVVRAVDDYCKQKVYVIIQTKEVRSTVGPLASALIIKNEK